MARKKISPTVHHSAKRPRQRPTTERSATTKEKKHTKQERPGARVIKKARRYRSGTAALREIRWLQTHGDDKQKKPTATFARAPFERIVRAIASNLMDGTRFTASAIDALKCASEEMVSDRLNAGMTVLSAQSREIKRGKFKGNRTGPVTLRTSHTAAYTRILCMNGSAPYLADCRDDADRLLGVQSQRTLHPISREDDEEDRLARRQRRGQPSAQSDKPRRKNKKSGAVAATASGALAAVAEGDAKADGAVPAVASASVAPEEKLANPVAPDVANEDSKGSTEVDVVLPVATADEGVSAKAANAVTAPKKKAIPARTAAADKEQPGTDAAPVASDGLIAMDLGDTDDDASDAAKGTHAGASNPRPVSGSTATPLA